MERGNKKDQIKSKVQGITFSRNISINSSWLFVYHDEMQDELGVVLNPHVLRGEKKNNERKTLNRITLGAVASFTLTCKRLSKVTYLAVGGVAKVGGLSSSHTLWRMDMVVH